MGGVAFWAPCTAAQVSRFDGSMTIPTTVVPETSAATETANWGMPKR